MKQVKGKDVLLEILAPPGDGLAPDWLPFVCCKDVAIKISPELISKTTYSSGKWNEYKTRRIDWTVTLSGVSVVSDAGWEVFSTVVPENIFTAWDIRMTFSDTAGNNAQFTGKILTKDASIDGNEGEFSNFDNTFQGTGAYTLSINGTPIGGGGGGTTPVKLNTPSGLAIFPFSDTHGVFTWTDTNTVPNESGFRLEVSTDAAFLSTIKQTSVGADAVTATMTSGSWPADTDLYFRIKAVGNGSTTTDSDWLQIFSHSPSSAPTTFAAQYDFFGADPYPSLMAGTLGPLMQGVTVSFGQPIPISTATAGPDIFVVVRYPDTESTKTAWYNTAFNNGTIPDSVFRAVETMGGFKYIISRIAATFDSSQPLTFS